MIIFQTCIFFTILQSIAVEIWVFISHIYWAAFSDLILFKLKYIQYLKTLIP